MSEHHPHLMTNADAICEFCLAGKARITLVSKATGNRFTYRVKASKDGAVYFLSVMTGSDNESNFTYAGLVHQSGDVSRTAKSKIEEDAPSFVAFRWFWHHVRKNGRVPEQLEVWHEGKCGRCSRTLTVPESIERGIGPECAGKVIPFRRKP